MPQYFSLCLGALAHRFDRATNEEYVDLLEGIHKFPGNQREIIHRDIRRVIVGLSRLEAKLNERARAAGAEARAIGLRYPDHHAHLLQSEKRTRGH